MMEDIRKLVDCVRTYNAEQEQLKQSYYFKFARLCPLTTMAIPNIIIMGINPMEDKREESDNEHDRKPYEVSFACSEVRTDHRGTKSWINHLRRLTADLPFIETEWFFWSGRNIGELEKRYGPLAPTNNLLEFCTRINTKLINTVKPKAVVSLGHTTSARLACSYQLTLREVVRDTKGLRLVDHYEFANGIPWFVCPHKNERRSGAGEISRRRYEVRDFLDKHLT